MRNARFRMLFVNLCRTIADIHVVMSIAFRRSSFFGPMNGTTHSRIASSYSSYVLATRFGFTSFSSHQARYAISVPER